MSSLWSSPKAEIGGALKALARNVATQMAPNRETVKRLVARIIAERHALGQVSQYKGHMYYANPERIDMTELLTQAKEALDDLVQLEQERRHFQAHRIRRKRSLPCKWSSALSRSTNAPFNLSSSTLERRSPTGVIIDKTHLRVGGAKRTVSLQRSKRLRLRKAKTLQKALGKTIKRKKLSHLSPSSKKSNNNTKGRLKAGATDTTTNTSTNTTTSTPGTTKTTATTSSGATTTNATTTTTDVDANATTSSDKRPKPVRDGKAAAASVSLVQQKKKKLQQAGSGKRRKRHQAVPLLQRTYDKPWLVRGIKRSMKRLTGSYGAPKSSRRRPKLGANSGQRVARDASFITQPIKNRFHHVGCQSVLPSSKKLSHDECPWYTPYQFPGGAGATQLSYLASKPRLMPPKQFKGLAMKRKLQSKYKTPKLLKHQIQQAQLTQQMQQMQQMQQLQHLQQLQQMQQMQQLHQAQQIQQMQQMQQIVQPKVRAKGGACNTLLAPPSPQKAKILARPGKAKASVTNAKSSRAIPKTSRIKSKGKANLKAKAHAAANAATNAAAAQLPNLLPTWTSQRRMRRKRQQARLIKDLLREEAIDNPGRMVGSLDLQQLQPQHTLAARTKQLKTAIKQQLQQPLPLALPLPLPALNSRRRSKSKKLLSPQPNLVQPRESTTKSRPKLLQVPKTKLKLKAAQPNQPYQTAMQTVKLRLPGQPKSRLDVVADPQLSKAHSSMHSAVKTTRRNTSRSGLTPAKRHLAIAFMNRRNDELRRHRGNVRWK